MTMENSDVDSKLAKYYLIEGFRASECLGDLNSEFDVSKISRMLKSTAVFYEIFYKIADNVSLNPDEVELANYFFETVSIRDTQSKIDYLKMKYPNISSTYSDLVSYFVLTGIDSKAVKYFRSKYFKSNILVQKINSLGLRKSIK